MPPEAVPVKIPDARPAAGCSAVGVWLLLIFFCIFAFMQWRRWQKEDFKAEAEFRQREIENARKVLDQKRQ